MKINQSYKLDKVALKDESYVPLAGLTKIRVTKKHAITASRHSLAIVPVQFEEGDTEGWLTPEALKSARKLLSKRDRDAIIGLNGSQALSDGSTLPRPKYAKEAGEHFPTVGPILHRALSNNGYRVGLDVSILAKLAEALGTEKIELTFNPDNRKEILVRPRDPDSDIKAYGVIMPFAV